jgi:hypothetical protein
MTGRRALRALAGALALAGLLAGSAATATWAWWRADPPATARSTGANALWAAHRWAGDAHAEDEYARLAATLRAAEVSEVFFHVGPLEADGTIPPVRYAHAGELLHAMARLAPGVRAQAYVGQVTPRGGGPLDLGRAGVRERIAATAGRLLDLGFAGVHYDIEPVPPGEADLVDLLARTRALTRAHGAVLSVALEDLAPQPGGEVPLALGDAALARLSPSAPYPTRTSPDLLRRVAAVVDQVAIMTYDSLMPTDWLVGRSFAWQTEAALALLGDRVTVFMGVPTYQHEQPVLRAENLATALRGVRKGIAALPRRPRRPYGVAVFAEWTTTPADWALLRTEWIRPGRR